MTSQRQIAANRMNAQRSTGPRTEVGKIKSRRNAIRHGLTAETVIGVLERTEDYRAFERAIFKEYRPRSTLEHELVIRLASLLWRLRRATAIETGLYAIQAGIQQGPSAKSSPPSAPGIFEIMCPVNDIGRERLAYKQPAILVEDAFVKQSNALVQ
ncbi:MAG: hypothetical protein RO009_22425 [Pseudorhodoplanes sp.]|jgi:hypothetical protein|nr:hypothetical protein [Pseudorhodoplanes sp.]